MTNSHDILILEFDLFKEYLIHRVHYISIVLKYLKIKKNKTKEFYTQFLVGYSTIQRMYKKEELFFLYLEIVELEYKELLQ